MDSASSDLRASSGSEHSDPATPLRFGRVAGHAGRIKLYRRKSLRFEQVPGRPGVLRLAERKPMRFEQVPGHPTRIRLTSRPKPDLRNVHESKFMVWGKDAESSSSSASEAPRTPTRQASRGDELPSPGPSYSDSLERGNIVDCALDSSRDSSPVTLVEDPFIGTPHRIGSLIIISEGSYRRSKVRW